MKQKFTLRTFLTALCSLALLGTTQAQTGANATWTLLSDPTASTSGSITAGEQTLGPLLNGIQYNTAYGGTANPTTGWQRVATTSGLRSTSDTAFNQGSYVEYSVTPNAGLYYQVNAMSVEILGGGTGTARVAAYYSTNGFTTRDTFPVAGTYNAMTTRASRTDSVVLINGGSSTPALTGQQVLSFSNMAINVLPGQTFTVRLYVWLTGYSATVRHLGQRNMAISGVTNGVAFPVKFASAKAAQKNGGVQVDWVSATEVNVSKYIIEKSNNGRTFTEAGSVAATGAGTRATAYSWYDGTPAQGNNYYRIKGVDKDGRSQYTGVLRVAIGKGARGFIVSPNPIRGNAMNLQISNLDKGTYNVQLLNSAGQKVFASQLVHQGGSSSEVMQIPTLQKGLYTLQLNSGSDRYSKRVIID